MSELEAEADLSAAEAWQQAQAWATYDKIKAGDLREASVGDLHEIVDRVRRRIERDSPRRP